MQLIKTDSTKVDFSMLKNVEKLFKSQLRRAAQILTIIESYYLLKTYKLTPQTYYIYELIKPYSHKT